MEHRDLPPKRDRKPFPFKWSSPLWYLPLMLLMLWFWQSTIVQFAYKTIAYSEFKQHLARGEVAECAVKETTIEGRLEMKPQSTPPSSTPSTDTNPPAKAKAASPSGKETFFRTVRVEDPKLVEELQAANVKFRGERPNFLSQFMLAWIIPIAVMFLIWTFISRRIGSAGESILSCGKSRARLVAERETGVKFSDVAGCEEAKYELQEVVDF